MSTWCKRFVARARAAGRDGAGAPLRRLPRTSRTTSFHRLPAVDVVHAAALPVHALPRAVADRAARVGLARSGVTHIELATPGPMGLVGLLVAKLLRLPVTASYHTEVPALVPTAGRQRR